MFSELSIVNSLHKIPKKENLTTQKKKKKESFSYFINETKLNNYLTYL